MRGQLPVILAATLILALGIVGYRILFADPAPAVLSVLSAQGQITHLDPSGNAQPARPGMALQPQEGLQVGANSQAELAVGSDGRIVLHANSALQILEASAQGVRIALEEGRVSARVRTSDPALTIENAQRSITATDGALEVGIGEDGTLQAQSLGGTLTLQNLPPHAQLQPGSVLTAPPGGEVLVSPVPGSLLQQVQWPTAARIREEEWVVEGQAAPYAWVQLSGPRNTLRVRADAQGVFSGTLLLQEGDNPLQIQVRDALGRVDSQRWSVVRDSQPPAMSADVRWGP